MVLLNNVEHKVKCVSVKNVDDEFCPTPFASPVQHCKDSKLMNTGDFSVPQNVTLPVYSRCDSFSLIKPVLNQGSDSPKSRLSSSLLSRTLKRESRLRSWNAASEWTRPPPRR